MILNFAGKETEKIFNQTFSKHFPISIQKISLRKLIMLDLAETFTDLMSPPANHLEKLVGNRLGQYSIRINRQYRICFNVTQDFNLTNVEIVDYH